MPRNAEVIRQWQILRAVQASRLGLSIHELAASCGVTTRTIRRDLDALQQAGFTLYDERGEGGVRWKLDMRPFAGRLETGFTLAELSALYFSRSVLECLAGTPFHGDLQSAFDKLTAALPPGLRRFLDRLPSVVAAKPAPARRHQAAHQREIVARLIEATLHQRRAQMQYRSLSSRRTKEYVVEPYRLVYSEGGLYLFGFVPEYRALRTFAVERIDRISLLEDTFEPDVELADRALAHSLGVHEGPPERVEIAFDRRAAEHVADRTWHPSQQVRPHGDGVLLTLDVSLDEALTRWILGWGGAARVLGPARLVEAIAGELEAAHANYVPARDSRAPGTRKR